MAIASSTGCRYLQSHDLGFSGQETTTTLEIQPVTTCPDNGQARVGLDSAGFGGLDVRAFDFYLYAGDGIPSDRFATYEVNGETYPKYVDGSSLTADDDSASYSNLPSGIYTAIARQKASSKCWTEIATDTVDQQAYSPIISAVTLIDNSICDTTSYGGNGSLTITAKKDANDTVQSGNFEFNWFVGTDTSASPSSTSSSAITSTYDNLKPGQYTVLISRLGAGGGTSNGCTIFETYSIADNPDSPSINGIDISNQVSCTSPDGSATITSGNIDGNASNYTFVWHQDSIASSGTSLGISDSLITNRSEGTFFVLVRIQPLAVKLIP